MLYSDSPNFKKYVSHVLQWEGRTSRDSRDRAASCAPFPGAYHTNKGVTYCTFKSYANSLGITPVNYDRFLKLTDSDVAKFIYRYYQAVKGSEFPDLLAIAMTEAAWGSGPDDAFNHLHEALKEYGITTNRYSYDARMKAGVTTIGPDKAYAKYLMKRKDFLIDEGNKQPAYKKGWLNRFDSFILKFGSGAGSGSAINSLFLLAGAGLFLYLLSKD